MRDKGDLVVASYGAPVRRPWAERNLVTQQYLKL
jgi:hypothetical protein